MNQFYKLTFSILLILFLSSCGSYKIFTGVVKYDATENNQVVKSSELNAYLESREKLKFVLRTPEGFDNFSTEEQIQWNGLFGQIEKELIKRGHLVKDRALLDLLLESNNLDLTTVGKAIDTDIIIEIIDFEYDLENHIDEFYIKEKNTKASFNYWNSLDYLDCRLAMLECRITLVEVGNVGGIFKFYVSGCDKPRDFYLKVYEEYNGNLNDEKDAFVGWNYGNVNYRSLAHSYDMDDKSKNMAVSRLVDALLTELTVNKEN